MTSEIVLNSASYMPSSAGVNLCILSPDYNSITQKRNILVFCKYWTYRDKPEEIIYQKILIFLKFNFSKSKSDSWFV